MLADRASRADTTHTSRAVTRVSAPRHVVGPRAQMPSANHELVLVVVRTLLQVRRTSEEGSVSYVLHK